MKGQHLFVWAAIDVDSREVLAVDASWQRSIMNAEHILKKALRSCINKPLILVDKGPWYRDALQSLGLKWKHVTRGMRNRIERWFRTLKEQTRKFYNNFPARKKRHKTRKTIPRDIHILPQQPENTPNPKKDHQHKTLS